MSLFDMGARRRFLACISVAFGTALLAGCQVQPLYGNRSTVESMPSVVISEPTSRVEQQVRNQLVFLLSGGAGEPANPEYNLQLKVTAGSTNYLSQISSNLPQPGRTTLVATYVLTRNGQLVKKGTERMDAQLDYTSQQFAQIRAVRDAENRAAKELAELLKLDIAMAVRK